MKKIEKFDKPACRIVAAAMEKALQSVAEEYGLKISVQGGRYDGMSYTAKVLCATLSESGQAQGPEVAAFQQLARIYGLKPEDLGREFMSPSGETFVLVGLAPKSRKYPFLAKNRAGKVFKFTERVVVNQLGASS